MIVPPSEIKLPAAFDFFDFKKWSARFPSNCIEWLEMFSSSQSFTQFLEVRLAPPDTPSLDVCFFNESIDAKLMRSAKTKFFSKHHTPLLTTGVMPQNGYNGLLVPHAVRTVYNASMIAARPVKSQQQVGLLLVLGSGMQEAEAERIAEFAADLKQEFARNLLWSRVNVDAALLVHVCTWESAGTATHNLLQRHYGTTQERGNVLENLPVRDCMVDLMKYSTDPNGYRQKCHSAVRQSLRELARDGGGALPLCVVAHGFGSVVAVDCFAELQQQHAVDVTDGAAMGGGGNPIERGETLAFMCTLGSPLPLLNGGALPQLQVPAKAMLARWPHLRGGWTNFRHKLDELAHPLQPVQSAVTHEAECRRRVKEKGAADEKDKERGLVPIQSTYFADLVDCVGPLAQSLSYAWQDVNRRFGGGPS